MQGSAPDGDASGNIFVVPVSGGQPRRLGPNLPPAGDPVWSPDSTQLLVCGNPPGISAAAADWWIVPIDGAAARKTGAFDALRLQGFFLPYGFGLPHAAAWVNGAVTFSAQKGDSKNIWRVPFHAGALSGTARRLTEGTTLEVFPSIAADGSLIFASLNRNAAIWALPLTSTATEAAREPQRLTDGSTSEATPSISADGEMLVYGATIPNHEDIWLKDLRTERETAIAASSAAEWHPAISRDGSMIAYTVADARQRGMLVISTTGGKPKWVSNISGWIFDWTPDKQYLLFHPKASPDPVLRRLDVRSGVVSAYLSKPGVSLFQAKFSPDANWLAFEGVFQMPLALAGDSQLFIVRVVNGVPVAGGEWIRVGDENGWSDKPRWSPDGNALIFLSDRDGFRCIWRQRLDPASKYPIGVPEPFHHFHESRLSPRNVGLGFLEMDVAQDKIVINLGELTGNIWSLRGR
ncbi:MAG: hypothetical protein M3Y07_10945 [Acidobacteriota bacterium]|nr:hypothetical protein [Acidobacteriota bacterium]